MKHITTFEDFVNESFLNEGAEVIGIINWLRKELINVNVYGEEKRSDLNYTFKNSKFFLEFEIQNGPNLTDFTARQYTSIPKPKFQSYMEKYARGLGDKVLTLGLESKSRNSVYPAFATEDKETMVKIVDELIKPINPSLAEKALKNLNKI